jgi:trehalose 6-phosphate phosphatase
MSSLLADHWNEITQRIAAAESVLLFLDFDGILAPLDNDPDTAELTESTRHLLSDLAAQEKVSVAVISGRDRADLQRRVNIPGFIYVGNHGLEISGPGFIFVEPTAVEHQGELQELAANLTTALQPIAGALVENKGLTISVHYRLVSAELTEEVRRIVHGILAKSSHPFLLSMGDKVFEIRPRVYWTKGAAIDMIRQKLGKESALAIYIGTDVTDADGATTLAQGITIKVGGPVDPAAQYHVEDPIEVHNFLEWLATRRSV